MIIDEMVEDNILYFMVDAFLSRLCIGCVFYSEKHGCISVNERKNERKNDLKQCMVKDGIYIEKYIDLMKLKINK